MNQQPQPTPSLKILRHAMARAARTNEELHSLARVMLRPGTKIEYTINHKSYYGQVDQVLGVPGFTRLRVINASTFKKRDIRLIDITGFVQEN